MAPHAESPPAPTRSDRRGPGQAQLTAAYKQRVFEARSVVAASTGRVWRNSGPGQGRWSSLGGGCVAGVLDALGHDLRAEGARHARHEFPLSKALPEPRDERAVYLEDIYGRRLG